jgi:hypothetical protein
MPKSEIWRSVKNEENHYTGKEVSREPEKKQKDIVPKH